MKEEQAHEFLYLLWLDGHLNPNFTEGHSEYDWAIDLLMNPKKIVTNKN